MLKETLIIVNPYSGKGNGPQYAEKLATILTQTYHANVTVRRTEHGTDAYCWSQEACQQGFDTVICMGGDGTVSEAVAGIMSNEDKPYFGIVPIGTANDLGRALGFDMDPNRAIEQYRAIKVKPGDVGKINDYYFINVVAIGSIPQGLMDTDSDMKNQFGFFAYLYDGLQVLREYHSHHLRITNSQGVSQTIETSLVLIGLTNSVGSFEVMFPKASFDDGLLHMIASKGGKATDLIKSALDYRFDLSSNDTYVSLTDTYFYIESLDSEQVLTNIDGDRGSALPIKVEVIPGALQFIIPSEL